MIMVFDSLCIDDLYGAAFDIIQSETIATINAFCMQDIARQIMLPVEIRLDGWVSVLYIMQTRIDTFNLIS
ncbi:hypothetical protein XBP1_400005 [Xenorhabdus bovienii str. puntauvense]|uniref:Uncharacterized protein n=1 Tax=Xenorhabdus bovienii str. puntauvense TaxID=1398201 RepID=A0A077N8S9_XENBV|nr:hypothetical protein XBP1_400005 [Xenorhabdus bovienii str. puntauvense]